VFKGTRGKKTMAPAASSLKRPASQFLKRPAGLGPAGKSLKRPAAKEEEKVEEPGEGEEEEEATEDPVVKINQKLTKNALKDHNKFLEEATQLDEKNFLKALSKLEPGAAQKLWKKFEKSRKVEGQEESYQHAMKSGPGSLEKKRKLLFLWVQNDKTCGERYREYVEKMSLVKTEGVKQKWLTTQEAVSRWGKEELWSRVQAGTILARRCPQDKRFWEFKSQQQVSKTEVQKVKETQVGCSGKLDKQTALEYQNMDWGSLHEDAWDATAFGDGEEEEGDENNKDLAKLLGVKLPKDERVDKEKNQKEKEWEEASKISAGDSKSDILDKVMKFKAEIEKDKSQLETKEYEAKKAGLKEPQLYKECQEVKQKLEAHPYALDSPCL
jgi:hypothetical protein